MTQNPGSQPAITFDEAADLEAQKLAAQATTSTTERVDAAGSLDPAVRAPLYALLSSLADNKFVLGKRYVEWCTGAPLLESAIASAAMAQDEMGHARSIYPLLRGFPEVTEEAALENEGWQTRRTSAMACIDQPFEAWVQFVAANFAVDTALTILFESATESWYEPLGQRARKITQEESGHWVHGRSWLLRLAGEEAHRPTLAACLEAVWDDALTWYGQEDDPVLAPLHQAQLIAAGPEQLRERLLARLTPDLQEAGLAVRLVSRRLPWDRWDPSARRLKAGQ
jgi:phenylacetate-CoA oxygenase PaaI subunit